MTEGQARTIIPRRQVVADAKRLYDVNLGDDRLDRLRAVDIIEDTLPIEGSNERGWKPSMARKILCVAFIIAHFKLKRPKEAEIAFWLAYVGFTVPIDLVLDHMKAALKVFHGRINRFLNSRGTAGFLASYGYLGRLGSFVAKAILKLITRFGTANDTTKRIVQLLSLLFMKAMFSSRRFSGVPKSVHEVLALIRGEQPTTTEAAFIWDSIEDFCQYLRPDGQNKILSAIDEFDVSDETALYKSVYVGRRFREVGSSVFPWFAQADEQTINPRWAFGKADYDLVNRVMPVSFCAIMLAMRNNPETIKLADKLLTGDTGSIVQDLAMARAMGNKLLSEPAPDGRA